MGIPDRENLKIFKVFSDGNSRQENLKIFKVFSDRNSRQEFFQKNSKSLETGPRQEFQTGIFSKKNKVSGDRPHTGAP